MKHSDFAITADHVWFSYATASKAPLFKNINLPLKRVVTVKNTALKDVSVRIRKNRITTLLGKNGSGKTTLIKLISGARLPQSGCVRVFGQNPNEVRTRLGIFMGSSLIYHRLTARENLEYFGKLYGVANLESRIDELADVLSLGPHLNQIVESFSFGMKTKLGLARAMIHSPDILILDEPTLGIDIELAQQLRSFIRTLECTVLLTTHYMEEAEELSDDLVLINKGEIISHGSKNQVFDDYKVESVPEAFLAALGGGLQPA